jgi:hypothetical protein
MSESTSRPKNVLGNAFTQHTAQPRHVTLIFLTLDRERYSATAPNSGTSVDAASTQSKPISELRERAVRPKLKHNASSIPPAVPPKTVIERA